MDNKRTIVLDWDGTLASVIPDGIITRPVHAARAMEINLVSIPLNQDGKPGRFLLILRPHLYELILTLSASYNLVLWTFAVPEYINNCLQSTGLHKLFHGANVITRADMFAWKTKYKDIFLLKERLGIRMKDTIIVDDSHFDFGILNPYNSLDIPSWTPDMRQDKCLKALPTLIDERFVLLDRMDEDELLRRREEILSSLK
jgi:TFIIF-interacting CTD phosphatase-like protein